MFNIFIFEISESCTLGRGGYRGVSTRFAASTRPDSPCARPVWVALGEYGSAPYSPRYGVGQNESTRPV